VEKVSFEPRPENRLGPPTCVAHSMRNGNQILHGDQTICEKIFTGSTPAVAKIVDATNADARSVCGS